MGVKETVFPDFDFEVGEVLLVDKPYEWTSFGLIEFLIFPTTSKLVHS